jgi:signal transduction histidine kinase
VTIVRTVDHAIGALIAVTLVVGASLVGLAPLARVEPISILLGVAGLLAASLTRRSSTTLAWLAAIGGGWALSTAAAAQARAADPLLLGFDGWLRIIAPAAFAAVVTLAIAASYANRPGLRRPPVAAAIPPILLAWLVVAIAVTIWAVADGQRADPAFTWIDVATLPIAWFVPFLVVVTGLGVVADVQAGLERARQRLGPSLAAARPGARTWSLALATANELVPGQAAAARATVEAERVRLAGDLHATVLPELRRAIADAEHGGDPEVLARHLRSVDLGLERLMADRWPIVLESFGLVAAIEDLAERLEADGSPPITIDVERSDGRPPAPVERASWRFAQVTLDNAVRHAAATTIEVRVAVDALTVRLEVSDDGRGPVPEAGPRPRARGLADARGRADAVGATVSLEAGPGGGTRATFDWAAAAQPSRGA